MAYETLADETFYGGAAGGGKAQSVDSQVLTPFGWRRIGDLKVGDKICDTEGGAGSVIGVYPQGKKQLYRIKTHDGGETLACDEHIWTAWVSRKGYKRNGSRRFGEESIRNFTTQMLIDGMSKGQTFMLPAPEACQFTVAGQMRGPTKFVRRELDPYVLGVLIGDGTLTGGKVGFTSIDEQLVDYMRNAFDPNDVRDDDMSYYWRGESLLYLKEVLEDLGLINCRSESKFIPRIYLFGSVAERKALLQGLMDTDGWADIDGDTYYCTTSERLRDDVAHLARSLGAIVTVTEKSPTYSGPDGEKLDGRPAWTLRVKLRDGTQAFRLDRKRERADKEFQFFGRRIVSIEPAHTGEAVCIRVSHPNSLYITDDFIVTHNTALLCGLAVNEHSVAHIFRRETTQVRGIVEELTKIVGSTNGLNSTTGVWRFSDTRTIEIAGIKDEKDKEKWQGRPADLKAFDEITHFSESQYRYVIGWNRSTIPGQRCRVIATGNPPTTAAGLWVIAYWGPWLDPNHPNPAKPGELRWYTTIDGHDVECPNGDPIEVGGKMVTPRSRTFIPAKLEDNPDLMRTNYAAVLEAMPDELRKRLRDGQFIAQLEDDEFQVIPTEWILAAQARWTEERPEGVPMTAMGVDIAQGGSDRTVLAPRYGSWFAPMICKPGKSTPDGPTAAAIIIMHLRDAAQVNIDLGGGWGGSAYDFLKSNDAVSLAGIVPGASTPGKTADGRLTFKNVRAEMWWRFREALDPSSGMNVALPPDPELRSELAAPTWKPVGTNVIQLEPKDDVKDKIGGRSPDKGDAVVMSWYTGNNKRSRSLNKQAQLNKKLPTMANLGGRKLHSQRRRRGEAEIQDSSAAWRDEQGL